MNATDSAGDSAPQPADVQISVPLRGRRRRRLRRVLIIVVVQIVIALIIGGTWITSEYRHALDDSTADLNEEGGQVQAAVSEGLEKVYQALSSVRAADLHASQLSLTTRLLRLERNIGPASDLFLFAANGKFIAANRPLPADGRDAIGRSWFTATLKLQQTERVRLVPVTQSPLSGLGGIIFSRLIVDANGTAVAVFGATIPGASIEQAASSIWLAHSARVEIIKSTDGTPLVDHNPNGASEFLGTGDPNAIKAVRLADIALSWLKISPVQILNMRIDDWPLRLTLEQRYMDQYIVGSWSTLIHHLLMVVIGIIVLCTIVVTAEFLPSWHLRRTAQLPARDAERLFELKADWIWELDRHGNLISVAGNFPANMDRSVRQPFAVALGVNEPYDHKWRALHQAIADGASVYSIRINLPGGDFARQQTFDVSGQPNEHTGGYWGVAVRVPGTLDGAGRPRTELTTRLQTSARQKTGRRNLGFEAQRNGKVM